MKKTAADICRIRERGVLNVNSEKVGQCLVIDNKIVKNCPIATTLEGIVQDVGASTKDMNVVVGSKLDKGITSLSNLLTYSSGKGYPGLLMACTLKEDTLVDIAIEITHKQERSTLLGIASCPIQFCSTCILSCCPAMH